MIPEIIHYCWFGRGPMPQQAVECIESWHRYMPDWEYRLWNEDNFDIGSVPYVSEAYRARKFAFVTDYVRLWALYNFGGVYMDTDVEVLRPYDERLMSLTAFTGYEGSKNRPPVTGTMASVAGGEWVREQLAEYDGLHFILPDGTFDMTSNTVRISRRMADGGFVADGRYQVFRDMHIFPSDWFCPRQTTMEYLLTENTYCDHKFAGSWTEGSTMPWYLRMLGRTNVSRLIKLKRRLLG